MVRDICMRKEKAILRFSTMVRRSIQTKQVAAEIGQVVSTTFKVLC